MRLAVGVVLLIPAAAGAQGLTVGERLRYAVHDTLGPIALFTEASSSGIQHWRDVPYEWGQGWAAYCRRFGYHLAGDAAEEAIEFGLGAALHEDPRYQRSGERRFWHRVWYVVNHTLREPGADGRLQPAYSRLIGDYSAEFLANTWYPPSANTAGEALLRGTFSVGGDLGSNAFHEFWPDVKRKLHIGRASVVKPAGLPHAKKREPRMTSHSSD